MSVIGSTVKAIQMMNIMAIATPTGRVTASVTVVASLAMMPTVEVVAVLTTANAMTVMFAMAWRHVCPEIVSQVLL
jgi:hypothetical protein